MFKNTVTLDIDDTDTEHACGTHSASVYKLKEGHEVTCLKTEALYVFICSRIKKDESQGKKMSR
jgi:hypothetical protein